MGKVEQDGRIEEFKNAMNSRNYEEAVQIADTLDIKHIRDNNLLGLIADAYELSNDFELAKQVLLYAYENTKAGRHLAYRLCLVSIKNGEYDEAEEFYEDFVEMAPKDTGRYVLQYKMAEARNESKDKLIQILEEYVNIDMEEKWAYELAKLYKETGDTDKCVELCDEMGLWFSDGRYIKKAMELKKSIQPLNITQQQLLDRSEPEEEKEEKGAPHVSKSPLASIMEKQPERTPYVDPEEAEEPKTLVKPDLDKPLGESKFESGIQNLDLSKSYDEPSEPSVNTFKPFTPSEPKKEYSSFAASEPKKEYNSFTPAETQDEYKPSFDITEIKVAEEPKIEPDSILTAQPVEEGPQQMSFFNDDSPSNNKYEVPEPETSTEAPSSFETQEPKPRFVMPEIEKPAEEPIPDVKDVEDMLKTLQERGILGADTVNKAVTAINSDTHQIEEELKEEVDSILSEQEEKSTFEEPTMEEMASDEPTEESNVEPEIEIPVEDEPEEEPEEATDTATSAEEYEKPQNRYSREVPEEINPIIPDMADNYSEDDEVADKIIQGKDFTQPDIPEVDDTNDSKFHTVQMGSKWEADDERVVDKEPVEMGVVDDIEPFEEPGLKERATKEIGDVLQKPTEVMPDNAELEKEKNKDVQAAKVLDEAVPPTSEEPKDVPVFDLSGEYKTQDNSEPEKPVEEPVMEELVTDQEVEEPAQEAKPEDDRLEPEPTIVKVLKESAGSSAQIDMITGDKH